MRPIETFSIIAVLTLGLACARAAGAASASETKSSDSLILDLSKFQREKFVADGKTNASWQTVVGRQVFDGVPFDIEGRGCVYGRKLGAETRANTNIYPDLIGLAVGRKFDELHLLHVTQWADVEGREIARIRLNYTDGSQHEFPILFGGQVRDWHRMPSEERELLTDPNTKIVWRAPGVPRIKSTLRLFKTVLANPHPGKAVATMDVLSSKHMAAYDLIAATVADRDTTRPVTPPVPAEGPERLFDGALTVHVTERSSGKPIEGALVDPNMQVDDVSVIAIPVVTSAAGEALIRYPVERATRISVSVEKEGFGSQRTDAGLKSSPEIPLEVELAPLPRITGVVRDNTGAPAAGVELALWPTWRASSKGVKTDPNGHFTLTCNPQNQNQPQYELCIVAQDVKRNLALAQTIEEDTTNVDLRLEPALTVTGRATGPGGQVLTNVEASVIFWTERMGASFGKPVSADSQGRFEIKALPVGRRYGVSVSAEGYGRADRTIDQDAEGRRIELEPCELARADKTISGIVLDADDKPVTNAFVYGYGQGQPSINGRTDSKGRFSFSAVCAGPIRVQANGSNGGYGSVAAEAGETNVTVQIGVQEDSPSSAAVSRITGQVTDPDGKPAPKVRVSLFPSFTSAERQTDSEGRFKLTFYPGQAGSVGDTPHVVIARDVARNLAAAVDVDEDATNATLRLEPALILTGRITDLDGKALTSAHAQAYFRTERMSSSLGSSVRTDAEGRFEIKTLPRGRQYSVGASARGFGQDRRDVEASLTATNRLELDAFPLLPANQRVAGVVLDDDDKPVARASLYTYGDKQPNITAQTDSKGKFSLDKVCAGSIEISANSGMGGFGHVRAEAGDTNVVIRIGASYGIRRSESRAVSLKGKPLPDLAPLGLTATDAPADQPVLALVIDAEQRPCRHTVHSLGEQAAALKEKGVAVIVVHTGTMAEEDFKAWKEDAALPFPVGCLKGTVEQARKTWGANSLPWFILTDKAHRVTAEGFAIEDLDAKLKDSVK